MLDTVDPRHHQEGDDCIKSTWSLPVFPKHWIIRYAFNTITQGFRCWMHWTQFHQERLLDNLINSEVHLKYICSNPLFEYVGFLLVVIFWWQGQHAFDIVLLLVCNVTCMVPTCFARESNASRKASLS